VLFPHDQRYGSASGVFHLALGAGRATVCSSSPKFGEAREIFGRQIPAAFAPARDVAAWSTAIETMLSNPALRLEAEGLAREAAQATSWTTVGARYVQLYREVATRAKMIETQTGKTGKTGKTGEQTAEKAADAAQGLPPA
jgi:hypothetical protein